MDCQLDIFFLEALLNGLLLAGLLALLALGLNLVFGVIDVVWICYAELMMIGMYAVYFLYTVLIVEQNIKQVLKVVERAYLLEVGRIKASGKSADLLASDDIRRAYIGL